VTVADVVVLAASGGFSVGFAHCVAAVPAVPAQAVIAMIAASVANERTIFSITNRFYREK